MIPTGHDWQDMRAPLGAHPPISADTGAIRLLAPIVDRSSVSDLARTPPRAALARRPQRHDARALSGIQR